MTEIIYYRISGNVGGELNLAVWRSRLEPPNYKLRARAKILAPGGLNWSSRLGPPPNLNSANIFECLVWSLEFKTKFGV